MTRNMRRRTEGPPPHLDNPAFVYRGGSLDSDAWSTRHGRGGLNRDTTYQESVLPDDYGPEDEEYRKYRSDREETAGESDSSERYDEERIPMRGPHYGKGPKGYVRSDERIRDEVNERLYLDDELDASEVEVVVEKGIVTLRGSVPNRFMKLRAQETLDEVPGVREVQNQLQIEGAK